MIEQWGKKLYGAEEIDTMIKHLCCLIPREKYRAILGIARGGLIPAIYLSHLLDLPLLFQLPEKGDTNDILVVDDLVDTGKTIKGLLQDTAVIFYKPRSIVKPTFYVTEVPNDEWIVFPWEHLDEMPNRDL